MNVDNGEVRLFGKSGHGEGRVKKMPEFMDIFYGYPLGRVGLADCRLSWSFLLPARRSAVDRPVCQHLFIFCVRVKL